MIKTLRTAAHSLNPAQAGLRRARRFKWTVIFAGILAPSASLAQNASPPAVRVTTSMGAFVIELAPERAPLTVANFLRYVQEGHYNGTLIHRVVSNFVIQGGGFAAADNQLKPTHEPVPNESGNGLRNKRGAVGMARGDWPHSANAQFYVDIAGNPDLDPLPARWGYAVFGMVVQGMEVVDRIGVVPTGSRGPFKADSPLTPVVIQKVEWLGAAPLPAKPSGQAQPSAPARSPPQTPEAPPAPPQTPPATSGSSSSQPNSAR